MTPREIRAHDLDGLSPEATRVVELARDEGRLFEQDYVGTEHILAGLARSGDDVVTDVFRCFDIGIEDVRTLLHSVIASGLMPAAPAHDVLTRRARRVLDLARERAADRPVAPPHLLLAILEEGSGGVAATILTSMDVDLQDVRQRLLERLASSER